MCTILHTILPTLKTQMYTENFYSWLRPLLRHLQTPNRSFHKIGTSEAYVYISRMLAIVLTCRVHLPFPPHFSNPLFPSNPPLPCASSVHPYNRMNHPFSYVSQNSRSLTAICCVSINTVSTPVLPFVTFYTIFSPPATDVPKCNYYCECCVWVYASHPPLVLLQDK